MLVFGILDFILIKLLSNFSTNSFYFITLLKDDSNNYLASFASWSKNFVISDYFELIISCILSNSFYIFFSNLSLSSIILVFFLSNLSNINYKTSSVPCTSFFNSLNFYSNTYKQFPIVQTV